MTTDEHNPDFRLDFGGSTIAIDEMEAIYSDGPSLQLTVDDSIDYACVELFPQDVWNLHDYLAGWISRNGGSASMNAVLAILPTPDSQDPDHLRFAANLVADSFPWDAEVLLESANRLDAANARRDREKAVIDKAAKALFDRDPTLMEHVETGRYLAQALYDAGLLADGDNDV